MKVTISQIMYFFPVGPTKYWNILFVTLFLPLQRSKQKHFHHKAFCVIQKWWNAVHCKALHQRYQCNFINNHQRKTQGPAPPTRGNTPIHILTMYYSINRLRTNTTVQKTSLSNINAVFYLFQSISTLYLSLTHNQIIALNNYMYLYIM
jgi:hypothetical protein